MANEDKKKSATLKALKEAGDEFYNRAVTNPKKVDDFITKTTVSLRTLYNVLDKYIKAAAAKTKAMAKRGANTAIGKGVDVVDAAKKIHSDVKEKGFMAVVRDGFNRADDSLSERIKSLTAAATAPPEQELTTKERLKGLLSSGKDYVTSNMSKAKDSYTEAKENVKNTFEQERLKVVLSDLDAKDRIRIRILKDQDVPKEGCKILNTRLGRIELSELNYEKVEDGESYLITNNFMIKSNDEAAITIRLYNPEEQAEGRKPGSFMARFGSLFRPPVEDSDEARKKKEEKEKKKKERSLGTKTLLSSMTDLMQGNFILGLTKLGLVPAAYTVPFVLKGLSKSLPAGFKGAGKMISFLAKPFLPKFLKGGKSKEDKKKEQKEKDGQESQGFFSRLKDKMTGRKKEVEDEKAASKEGLKKKNKKGKDLGILGMILSAVTGLLTIGPKQIASMLGSGLWWLTKQIGKGLWWGVKQLGNFIWDKTKALGRAIGEGLGKVKDKVVGKLADVGTKIKTSVLNIGSKLGKGLTAVKDGVFNVGKNIFSFGSNMLAHGKNLLDGVKNIVPGITQGLGGVFRSVMGGLSSAFGTLGGKLVTGIYTVTTKITELATIIPRAISGLFKFGGGKAAEAAGGKAATAVGGKVLAKALGPIGAGIDVADGMSDLMSGKSQESISGFEWLSPMRIGMYIGDKFNKAWEAMTGGTSLGNSIYNALNEDPMAKMEAEQKARDAERLKAQEAAAKPKQQAQTTVPTVPAAAPKPAAVPVGASSPVPIVTAPAVAASETAKQQAQTTVPAPAATFDVEARIAGDSSKYVVNTTAINDRVYAMSMDKTLLAKFDSLRAMAYGYKQSGPTKNFHNVLKLESIMDEEVFFNETGNRYEQKVGNSALSRAIGSVFGFDSWEESGTRNVFYKWMATRFMKVYSAFRVAIRNVDPKLSPKSLTSLTKQQLNAILNDLTIPDTVWSAKDILNVSEVSKTEVTLDDFNKKKASLIRLSESDKKAEDKDSSNTASGKQSNTKTGKTSSTSSGSSERGFFGKMYDSAVDYTSRGIEAVANTASEVAGSMGVVASGTWNTLKGKPKEIENMVIASLQKEGITDPKTMSYIMGQLAHETGNFRYMEEIASGAKYEGRRDLGNSSPGDGVKYKGRGVIQITGKANYAAFSKDTGIDIVNNPTLASQPDVAVKTALWYLKKRKLLSKAAAGDIKGLTKGINGGFNGLDDRIAKTKGYLSRFAKGIDVVNTPSAAAGGGSMIGRVADAIGGSMAGTAQVVGSAVGISPDTISAGTNAVGNAITSAGNALSSAGSAVAGAVVNMSSSLKTILDSITDELVALGKSHFNLGNSSVTLEGMNETFMKLFWAMLGESKKKGGPKVQINDGFRSLAEQTRLWNLYKSGQKKEACARPGTSRHGFGVAIDINTANANWLDKSGLLAKYGFERPLMHLKKPETWHIENKFIKKGGMPTPVIGKPKEEKTDKKPAGGQPVIAAAPTGNDSPSAATPVPVQDQPGVVQNTTVPAVSSIEANNGVTVASMATNKINEGMSKLGKSLDSAVDNIPVDKLNIGKALFSPGQAASSGKPVDNSSSAGNAEAMFDISKSMQETMTKQLSALLSISDILKSIEAKVGGGQTTASTSKPSNAKEEAVKPTQRTEGIPGRQATYSPNNRVDLSRKLNVENEL